MTSNGTRRVVFLNWQQGDSELQYYAPKVERRDFPENSKFDGAFTKTVFIPNSQRAVTGTELGLILVWDRSLVVEKVGDQNEKRIMKIVNFAKDIEITTLTTVHDRYLVTGYKNGHIKFYDFDFKIIAWFDDLGFSDIKSISFSKKKPQKADHGKTPLQFDQPPPTKKGYGQQEEETKSHAEDFSCSDFLVSDANALITSLKSDIFEAIKSSGESRGYTLMCGIKSSICGVAVHPHEPLVAIAGSDGFVLLWNYEHRQDEPKRNFEHIQKDDGNKVDEVFCSIEWVPDGSEILVGKYNGIIAVMDS